MFTIISFLDINVELIDCKTGHISFNNLTRNSHFISQFHTTILKNQLKENIFYFIIL